MNYSSCTRWLVVDLGIAGPRHPWESGWFLSSVSKTWVARGADGITMCCVSSRVFLIHLWIAANERGVGKRNTGRGGDQGQPDGRCSRDGVDGSRDGSLHFHCSYQTSTGTGTPGGFPVGPRTSSSPARDRPQWVLGRAFSSSFSFLLWRFLGPCLVEAK